MLLFFLFFVFLDQEFCHSVNCCVLSHLDCVLSPFLVSLICLVKERRVCGFSFLLVGAKHLRTHHYCVYKDDGGKGITFGLSLKSSFTVPCVDI